MILGITADEQWFFKLYNEKQGIRILQKIISKEELFMKALMKLWVKQNHARKNLKERVQQVLHNERGQGMVEYGLILALVAIVVIVMLTNVGNSLLAKFTDINNNLQ